MALIGKDGKDDASVLLGQRILALNTAGLRIVPEKSYFKVLFSGFADADIELCQRTEDYLDMLSRGNLVDSYGLVDSDTNFVVIAANDISEAEKFVAKIPLISQSKSGAEVKLIEKVDI